MSKVLQEYEIPHTHQRALQGITYKKNFVERLKNPRKSPGSRQCLSGIKIANDQGEEIRSSKGRLLLELHFRPNKITVPLGDDERAYSAALEQTGYGMPKHRGSPMMDGSF